MGIFLVNYYLYSRVSGGCINTGMSMFRPGNEKSENSGLKYVSKRKVNTV